jgi:hypothetical protein
MVSIKVIQKKYFKSDVYYTKQVVIIFFIPSPPTAANNPSRRISRAMFALQNQP